jgi:hypothetical protein
VFLLPDAHGRRLAAGEPVTLDDVYNYAGDHTAWGASPLPDKVYSIEFSPVSAPDLFCRTDLDHPGETQGATPHPTDPVVSVTSSEGSGGSEAVFFRTYGVFPGLRVTYRMLMRDGTLQQFTTDLTTDVQGITMDGRANYDMADLAPSDPATGHKPWFQGITSIELNGQTRPCKGGSNPCAPADGSLLDRVS